MANGVVEKTLPPIPRYPEGIADDVELRCNTIVLSAKILEPQGKDYELHPNGNELKIEMTHRHGASWSEGDVIRVQITGESPSLKVLKGTWTVGGHPKGEFQV